jgi:hypothetical protein
VAIMPAALATALLSPEATPVWRVSTELKTAAVSGAAMHAIPSAITTIDGSTVVQ